MDWKVYLFVCLFVNILIGGYSIDPTDTVYDVLQRTQGLSKFESLVRKANLVDFFRYPNDYTIFAPNDTAYENLTPERKQKVEALNGTELQNFVKFHAIEGQRLTTGGFRDNSEYRTMSSRKIYINRREGSAASGWFGPTTFYVNGAIVSPEQKDLVGVNGVVHGLMIWLDMTSLQVAYQYTQTPDNPDIKSTKFYTEILNKLALSGQFHTPISELQDYNGKITLFVPDDAAIEKIPVDKLRELQSDVQKLHRVVRSHYINNMVMFTTYVNHNQGFINANELMLSIRKPYPYTVFVNSGGVTAEIKKGNVTVTNGVIHVCDTLLGYIYNTVRQQIAVDSPVFDQLINKAPEETRKALVDQSGVNVFVPTAEAFAKIINVPWVNLGYDTALIDKVLRLHILQPGESVTVSTMVGEYESRLFKRSLYFAGNNPMLTIYRMRNETWVQGDTVIAKIVRADVEGLNGRIQYIDTILGIPYLDMTNLICSDLWLLRTYDYMRAVGMKNYLTDRRFYSKQCDFETLGYPPNYGINNYYSGGYVTIPPWPNTPAWDMGYCGTPSTPCQMTFFAPNSSAIDYFSNTDYGKKIMINAYLLQNVFKRLLFPQRIELQALANANYNFRAVNGDVVRVSKSNDRYVEISFQRASARVIHMDNGGTNGIVHIIDTVLYVPDDLTVRGFACHIQYSSLLILLTVVCVYFSKYF